MLERHTYSADSLRKALDVFEARFKMTSDVFYGAYCAEAPAAADVPRFLAHSWASFYRDWRRLSGFDFAENVSRQLAVA